MQTQGVVTPGHSLSINVASFALDQFGRYDVEDPDILDLVAGGWGGGQQQEQNMNCGGCNGNCGCA